MALENILLYGALDLKASPRPCLDVISLFTVTNKFNCDKFYDVNN